MVTVTLKSKYIILYVQEVLTQNFVKSAHCSQKNDTLLIKQIFLFDTAYVMTNTLSFNPK